MEYCNTKVMEPCKKRRAANFTDEESAILLDIIQKHIDVVENQRPSATVWKAKEMAWKHITAEYNSAVFAQKSTVTLKSKYEGLKKIARKFVKSKPLYKKEDGEIVYKQSSLMRKVLTMMKSSNDRILIKYEENSCPSESDSIPGDNSSDLTSDYCMQQYLDNIEAHVLEPKLNIQEENENNELQKQEFLNDNITTTGYVCFDPLETRMQSHNIKDKLLLKEFENKERREDELHKIKLSYYKLKEEHMKLEIELKKAQLSEMVSRGNS